MPRVELRDYRKARTPFGSLMRLFRYFKHCRLILICAVVSILVYAAATILGRITIGAGSMIGGNVWLTHSVPPGSKVVQQRSTEPKTSEKMVG